MHLRSDLEDLITATETAIHEARAAADTARSCGDWNMEQKWHAVIERYEHALVHLNRALGLL